LDRTQAGVSLAAMSREAGLGFDSIAGYLAARRGAGWTWQAIAAESGQPPTWLRRRAAPAERR
jgi:hypothetical protein